MQCSPLPPPRTRTHDAKIWNMSIPRHNPEDSVPSPSFYSACSTRSNLYAAVPCISPSPGRTRSLRASLLRAEQPTPYPHRVHPRTFGRSIMAGRDTMKAFLVTFSRKGVASSHFLSNVRFEDDSTSVSNRRDRSAPPERAQSQSESWGPCYSRDIYKMSESPHATALAQLKPSAQHYAWLWPRDKLADVDLSVDEKKYTLCRRTQQRRGWGLAPVPSENKTNAREYKTPGICKQTTRTSCAASMPSA